MSRFTEARFGLLVGFCPWDSDLTGYKATRTSVGRDLLAPMTEAFNALARPVDPRRRSGRGLVPPQDCRYTRRGDRLHLRLFGRPMRHVHLEGRRGRVTYAQFLHDASAVRIGEPPADDPGHHYLRVPPDRLTLELPVGGPMRPSAPSSSSSTTEATTRRTGRDTNRRENSV